MSFLCTIHEAETEIKIKVARAKSSTPLETLRMQKQGFLRRYRSKIPSYVKELLMRKQFSFCSNAIKGRAYREGDEYRLNYHFFYEDARTTNFQACVRRLTKWKIIATDIQITHNGSTKVTTLKVKLTIFKPATTGPTYVIEVTHSFSILVLTVF